ncbi:hypothetical protein ACH4PU_11750 [Streptomyces sp. NPDC021100]|uniref:hypothetical protein n=1 Tax=Streptomyces sp. NPDC021100 TaxID=3365114 RepID=UPI0037A6E4BB
MFFAAMAEKRDNIRESALEGLDTTARKGKHGGRPAVITDDMLHTVLRRRALGESVEQVQPNLIIPTGKRKGPSPSVATPSAAGHPRSRNGTGVTSPWIRSLARRERDLFIRAGRAVHVTVVSAMGEEQVALASGTG